MSLYPLVGVAWLLVLFVVWAWCRSAGRADQIIEGWRSDRA